jgi:FKBP-type peptidyl-prolyl cis-trans isomerase FkpA
MKRNHHFLLLATVAILVVAFSSFSKDKKKKLFSGYKKIEGGSYFLLNTKGSGTTVADTGGAVFVKIKFLTETDSVFLDINEATHAASYPMRVDKAEFKGDFLDIFTRLHAGDSATFFVRMDSLNKYYPNEFNFKGGFGPAIDSMKYLGFAVKVDSIYDRAKVQALRAAAAAEQEKQNAMILKMKDEEPVLLLKYITANKITAKPTASGVYYIEAEKGKGKRVEVGQTVAIHYTGKFIDGEVFDSSIGREPLTFVIGSFQVIPGLEEGLLLMNNGGKATIIIPSELAYKDGGGRMKPYATLIFDVEIVSVQDPPVAIPR